MTEVFLGVSVVLVLEFLPHDVNESIIAAANAKTRFRLILIAAPPYIVKIGC
jgi:hypothetical protein